MVAHAAVTSEGWLPAGRRAAVCLSVDDVHPGRSTDAYEAGGDLAQGVLGRLEALLERHPQLRATLFVTPNWRERSPVPTRTRLARVPLARDVLHLTPPLPRDRMRLDRHPAFVGHLQSRDRFEIAVHGLTHLARGRRPAHEFARIGRHATRRRVRRAAELFDAAGLRFEHGFCPPGWGLADPLLDALADAGYRWVSAARDITTPISATATTAGSGLQGVPLLHPHAVADGRLVHVPVNFQATSDDERAEAIIEHGGLVSIKAHAVKDALGYIALDGLDDAYCSRLDRLFTHLEGRYGDALWWTTMGEVASRARAG